VKRRAFLTSGAAVAGGIGLLPWPGDRAGASTPDREPVDHLLPGTEHETPVYAFGDESGPTGLVVGGVHGDERSGYLAAERILEWELTAGRLVILPRANRVAIEAGTRHGEGGDLNRKFPPGETPTTPVARAIWDFVERTDPAVAMDLHSSWGLYRWHAGSVGQAVFSTDFGGTREAARAAVAALNETVVPWYMPLHDYHLGSVIEGTAPLLAHKVAGDLGSPAYVVETTDYLVDARTGARWTERTAAELLDRHGIERRGAQ
jgi:hypothetical protein